VPPTSRACDFAASFGKAHRGREYDLDKREGLLALEKELTRQYDRVNAERRRLPMVRIEKKFEGPGGVRR
jgi:predicted dithiol-disulfide oxidoreductase (DUF899 family)